MRCDARTTRMIDLELMPKAWDLASAIEERYDRMLGVSSLAVDGLCKYSNMFFVRKKRPGHLVPL